MTKFILITAVAVTSYFGLIAAGIFYSISMNDDDLPQIALNLPQTGNVDSNFNRHVQAVLATSKSSRGLEALLSSQGFEIERVGDFLQTITQITATWRGHRFPCDHVITVRWNIQDEDSVSDILRRYGLTCP